MKASLIVPTLLAAVTGGALTVQDAPRAPFSTFEWKEPVYTVPSDPALAREQVRSMLAERLQSVGYAEVAQGQPDLWVSFYLVRRESTGLPSDATTLVVDIVDGASSHLIWRSLESDMSGSTIFAARFAGRKTYGWKEISAKPGEVPLYTQVDRKVRTTIEAALLHRGLDVSPPGRAPDVLVAYHVVSRGADVRVAMKPTLTVEIFAPANNELLWRGQVEGDLAAGRSLEDVIIDAVVELGRQVPPRFEPE